MRVNLVAGVKEEVKKKYIFFVLKIYEGELGLVRAEEGALTVGIS